MALRISLYIVGVAAILALAGVSISFAEGTAKPYYVWGGQLPGDESVCTLQYDPVVGKDGNAYTNPCYAALSGVRITYK